EEGLACEYNGFNTCAGSLLPFHFAFIYAECVDVIVARAEEDGIVIDCHWSMYRATRSVAPEKAASCFIESQQSAVFAAEINPAAFNYRLTAKYELEWYRPEYATGSLVKRVSSTITAAGKYFSTTQSKRAAQWPD